MPQAQARFGQYSISRTENVTPLATRADSTDMPSPLHAHRRSYRDMTILASCAAALLVVLIGAALYLPRWNSAHQQFPVAGLWVAATLMALVLAMLCAFALLVAMGGCVALYRDWCEERGVPYAPIRPRERIHGPMLLA